MIDNYYTEEYSLLVSTKTADGYGGKTETWAAVANSSFMGRKRLLSSSERIADSAEQYTEQYKIYCDVDVPVTRSNMITGVDGDMNILSIDNKWGHHLEIIVSKGSTE
jgi:head-tail adaptor